MDLFRRNEPVLLNRDLYERPAPVPQHRIRNLTPDLAVIRKRQSDSDGSTSSRHAADTTPIVIGVVVPVVIIFIILFVIWKRRQRINKMEDANDKYKSLDFGIDDTGFVKKKGRKGTKNQPEMSVAELKGTLRGDKGLSLDLTSSSPYILPPEVHQSRESLHSLSRNLNTGDDKYQRTTFIPDDGSIRSPSSLRSHGDTSSIFSASTRHRTGTMETESRAELISRFPAKDLPEVPTIRKPTPAHEKPQSGLLAPGMSDVDRNSTMSTNSNTAAFRQSNNYLGQFIKGGHSKQASEIKNKEQPGLMVTEVEVQPTPPGSSPTELPAAVVREERRTSRPSSRTSNSHRVQSSKRSSSQYRQSVRRSSSQHGTRFELPDSSYDNASHQQIRSTTSDELDNTSNAQFPKRTQSRRRSSGRNSAAYHATANHPPVPEISVEYAQATNTQQPQHVQDIADDASDYYDEELYEDYMAYSRMSMMGQRPLPPDDPNDNPEQRASRIRSFYKEYFDDSKGGQKNNVYYDGSEQFDNYEAYDDFDYGYYESAHSRGPSLRSDGRYRSRAFSQGSRGYYNPGPRAYSSMSGRMNQRHRMPPKKKLPPPKALMVLPTPGKLKDEDFLPNAIDFAPPQVFKNQRSGTPDSLRGGSRPYSPSVRPHIPLVSSFDDLAVVPSPHALRNSRTFTGLDFAPPRRFKEGSSQSDAGSIRSYRSNVSQMQLQNIRNGAYRVSRIPKEVAGTKDDMFTALKPTWDMRGSAGTPTVR